MLVSYLAIFEIYVLVLWMASLMYKQHQNKKKKINKFVKLKFKTSSPWAVKLSWQRSYVSKMIYKPSKLGQTDLVLVKEVAPYQSFSHGELGQ